MTLIKLLNDLTGLTAIFSPRLPSKLKNNIIVLSLI